MRIFENAPKQILLILQGTFENLEPTSDRKFLLGVPRNVGRKVPGTSLPISSAFLGANLGAKTSRLFPEQFSKLRGVFQRDFCFLGADLAKAYRRHIPWYISISPPHIAPACNCNILSCAIVCHMRAWCAGALVVACWPDGPLKTV